jgi:hypothetical protein
MQESEEKNDITESQRVKIPSETKRMKKKRKRNGPRVSISLNNEEKVALSQLEPSARKVLLSFWNNQLSNKRLRKAIIELAEKMSHKKLKDLLVLNLSAEVWTVLLQQNHITWPKVELAKQYAADPKGLRMALQPKEDEEEGEKFPLKGLRFLYVAGGTGFLNAKTVASLEEAGAKVKAVECERVDIPLDAYDYVLIHTRVSSHSAQNSYASRCRGENEGKLILLGMRIRPSTIVSYLRDKLETRSEGAST